uniref:Uncharacterized protein n=1 Tax=Lygus hesperus TaxID=30085 RepID=A0A146MHV1_LYGHE
MLPEDIEKILELYAKEDKSPNEAEKSRNPMIDYLGKIYSFRNYDLLRPYRSIFRGLKTFGKHDHTTQSSWLKFLRRGKYLTDDYWELNQPEVTKMPYHRQREQARIEKLNKEAKSVSTGQPSTSSAANVTNTTQAPSHRKRPHLKSPFDVLGRKEYSTPPSLRFCEKPCDALEVEEAQFNKTRAPELTHKDSLSSEEEVSSGDVSSGENCDDYEDVEVFSHKDSTDVINIPFNKHSFESAWKAATHAAPTQHPHPATTHKNTKPPKLKVYTGTSNPLIWTLPPHPILDKTDNANIISTRLQGGGDTHQPATAGASDTTTACSTTCHTSENPSRPPFCITRRRKPQKIIVRISSSLGEVPVVIMRDNRTCGVSLSLVNDFILDEKNNLYKKVNHKNTLLTIKSKFNFNQSKVLPEIKISRKTAHRNPAFPQTVLRPQPWMQSPLFAVPPRQYPFQLEPLNPLSRVYGGFPETRIAPEAYPQPYIGLRPPLLPLYFSGGSLPAPIPPPRRRFEMKVE